MRIDFYENELEIVRDWLLNENDIAMRKANELRDKKELSIWEQTMLQHYDEKIKVNIKQIAKISLELQM